MRLDQRLRMGKEECLEKDKAESEKATLTQKLVFTTASLITLRQEHGLLCEAYLELQREMAAMRLQQEAEPTRKQPKKAAPVQMEVSLPAVKTELSLPAAKEEEPTSPDAALVLPMEEIMSWFSDDA